MPAAKLASGDLSGFALPESAEVVVGRKNSRQLQKVRENKLWGSGSRKESASHIDFNNICNTIHLVEKTKCYQHFSFIISNKLLCHTSVVASEILRGHVSVVRNVLSSHVQNVQPTISLDENCRVSAIQTDHDYYADSIQNFLTSRVMFVKARACETNNGKEVEEEHNE